MLADPGTAHGSAAEHTDGAYELFVVEAPRVPAVPLQVPLGKRRMAQLRNALTRLREITDPYR